VIVAAGASADATITWRSAIPAENAASEVSLFAEREAAVRQVMKLVGQVSPENPALEIPFLSRSVPAEAGGAPEEEEEGKYDAEGAQVLNVEANTWESKAWKDLLPGDVVRVERLGHFPADLLLLHASTPSEVCIETSCWDGDGSLRQWQVAPMSFTGADKEARVADPAALHTSLNLLGNGDPAALEALRNAGQVEALPIRHPSDWDQWSAKFSPAEGGGGDAAHFGFRQLLPHNARLVVTDWVLGLVLSTRGDSSFARTGGWRGMERANSRRKAQEEEDKRASEASRQLQVEAMCEPVLPADYETETGVLWKAVFTDVPDDGNCLMHAVWKGLGELLKHYPDLRIPGEKALPENAALFRKQALADMTADPIYRGAVANQLQLWLSVDCDLLFSLEDFFCMPPSFQSEIVDLNMQVQQAGADPSTLEMPPLVDAYIASLSEVQTDSGRDFFLPLGELELEALCRNLRIRLQVVKTEALDVIAAASKRAHPVPENLVTEVLSAVASHVASLKAAGPAEGSEGGVVEALDLVLLYLNNIAEHPGEPKFRSVKAANAALVSKVTSKPAGDALLKAVGFQLDAEAGAWVMHDASETLEAARQVLQDALAAEGELTRAVDPRTIRPEHIYDRSGGVEGSDSQDPAEAAVHARRIVRVLNVRTNHYQVHLPRPP